MVQDETQHTISDYIEAAAKQFIQRILQKHISLLIRRNFYTCQAKRLCRNFGCPLSMCEFMCVSGYFTRCGLILLKDFFSYLRFTPSFLPFNVLIDEFVCMYNNRKSSKQNEKEQQKRAADSDRAAAATTRTTTAQNQRQENKAIYQSYVNFHFN